MNKCELSVDVTYKCPFSCPFCSSPQSSLPSYMTTGVAYQCLNFVRDVLCTKNEMVEISITGGEPLTFRQLPFVLSIWSNDSTTLTLCTTAAIDVGKKYWEDLRSSGLRTVRISLHAASEKKCRNIFGSGYSYEIVNKNVELIKAVGIAIHINFLVGKFSVKSFDEVWKYCEMKDINKIRVLGLCRQGKAVTNWEHVAISEEDEVLLVEHISELSTGKQIYVEYSGLPNHRWCIHSDEKGTCLGGTNFFHINPNGDIFACPSVKSKPEEKIGTVFKPMSERYLCTNLQKCINTRSCQVPV